MTASTLDTPTAACPTPSLGSRQVPAPLDHDYDRARIQQEQSGTMLLYRDVYSRRVVAVAEMAP